MENGCGDGCDRIDCVCGGVECLQSRPQAMETVGLRISEVMSDTDDVSVDWIEIENAGETEISLYGYALVNAAEPKRRLYSQAARLRRANIWWYSRTARIQPKGTALFTRRSGCPPAARRFTF